MPFLLTPPVLAQLLPGTVIALYTGLSFPARCFRPRGGLKHLLGIVPSFHSDAHTLDTALDRAGGHGKATLTHFYDESRGGEVRTSPVASRASRGQLFALSKERIQTLGFL
jgi:hypothetical protein